MVLPELLDPRLLGLALVVLIVFLVLTATFAGFSMVGFTPGEVVVLLFLAPFVAGINLPIWSMDGLVLGVNAAGLVIPVGLTIRFLYQGRLPIGRSLVGVGIVTFVAYKVATVEPDTGILVPVIPIVVSAAVLGLGLANRRWRQVGPITYASGTMGTLIGADLLHVGELVDPTRSEPLFAVMGGAGTLDAIYVVSLWAVGATILAVALARLMGQGR